MSGKRTGDARRHPAIDDLRPPRGNPLRAAPRPSAGLAPTPPRARPAPRSVYSKGLAHTFYCSLKNGNQTGCAADTANMCK